MKKLLLLLFVVFFTTNSISQTSFTVTVDLDGITTLKNTSASSHTKWEYEYGPTGFTPGMGITETNINAPIQTKKFVLNPFQSYDFRIRIGNNINYYAWSPMYTLSNCLGSITTLPYTNNFDGNPVQDCWRGYNVPTNDPVIALEPSTTNYYGTSGSSVRISNSTASGSAVLVAPKFSGLATDKMVTFMVKGYTGSSLKVGTLTDPYDINTFHELQTAPVQTSANNWYKIYTELTNYNGTDQYIALKYDYITGGPVTIYVDNFTCMQACSKITTLNVSNITEHTAQLNFTAPGQDTWQVNVTSSVIGIAPQQYTTTSNPFNIPDLIQNTPYQVKIRAVCGPTNESAWSEPINFTTICNPMVPGYSTSFEGDYSLDPCWSRIATSDSNISMQNALYNGTLPVLSPKTGSKLLWMNNTFNASQQPMYLISPYIDNINNTKRLSLFLASNSTALEKNSSSLIIGTIADPNDMSTFQQIREITPVEINEIHNLQTSGDYWKEHIIYFNNYNNTNNHHYIALKHNGAAQPNILLIDDLTFEEIPTCTEPVDLKLTERWWNHVTVSWVNNYSGSTATEWQIEYGPAGFVLGTGTVANVTSNPATLNNLQEDTEYQFYVRSKCGANYSGWSDKGKFRTRCTGVAVGYAYGFENESYGDFNSCWERIMPEYQYAGWTEETWLTTINNVEFPSNDQAHSGSNYLYLLNKPTLVDANAAQKNILITPRLVDFGNDKKVSFWMNMGDDGQGNNIPGDEVIVGTITNPDDYTTFSPFYTITDAFEYMGQWKKYTVNFSTYTGTDEYVAIKHAAGSSIRKLLFDDFEYNNVGCEVPSFLKSEQTGNSQITLAWNNGNNPVPPTEWQIEYGPIGFEEGTGTIVNVTTNPAIISGLPQYIKQEYRVRNKCGTQYGDWSQRLAFRVSCTVTAPFYENFDQYAIGTGTNYPDEFCWTDITSAQPSLQEVCLDEISSCPNAYSLAVYSAETGPYKGIVASPYLPDFNNTKRIRFYARDVYQQGTAVIVGTMTNPMDTSTFVPYTTVSLADNGTSGKQYEVSFEAYTGSAHHIAFRLDNQTANNNYTYIDDIRYMEMADCKEPLNAAAYNINNDSALIHWDATENVQGFEIEYGVTGFTQGTGTTVTTATDEKILNGLTASTQYQFYIRTICSGTAHSIWAGPVSFTTTCSSLSLPWIESFNTMNEYGENKLPECFRNFSENAITSHNTAVADPFNFEPDNQMSGTNDTSFLHINTGFSTDIMTPMFTLTAGTTYKFSFMGRKGNEYSPYGYNVKVGRGNTYQAMETFLFAEGQLHQTNYNEMSYLFTPLVSGDYSFNLNFISGGAFNLIIDDLQLQEGYTSLINNSTSEYDFESGISEDLVIESTGDTWTSLYNESDGNTSLFMQASANPENWQETAEEPGPSPFPTLEGNTIWFNNKNFITKVNMKADTSQMTSLTLSFDLKETAETNIENSAFRVVINGNQISEDILPETLDQDDYTTHEFDLTPYIGGPVYISLQHIGRSSYNTGDSAFLDNIKLNADILGSDNFELTNLMVYPNPVKDILSIKNTDTISSIEIISISGQKLYSQIMNTNETEIDLSAYSDGIYFVKVTSNEKQKTLKIIKK